MHPTTLMHLLIHQRQYVDPLRRAMRHDSHVTDVIVFWYRDTDLIFTVLSCLLLQKRPCSDSPGASYILHAAQDCTLNIALEILIWILRVTAEVALSLWRIPLPLSECLPLPWDMITWRDSAVPLKHQGDGQHRIFFPVIMNGKQLQW